MARGYGDSLTSDASMARVLQEQEQQLANDALVAALLQEEEMDKASRRKQNGGPRGGVSAYKHQDHDGPSQPTHDGREWSLNENRDKNGYRRSAYGGREQDRDRRPAYEGREQDGDRRPAYGGREYNGDSQSRYLQCENWRSTRPGSAPPFVFSNCHRRFLNTLGDAALAQSVYDNEQKSYIKSDEEIARALQVEEEKKAEQQRQQRKRNVYFNHYNNNADGNNGRLADTRRSPFAHGQAGVPDMEFAGDGEELDAVYDDGPRNGGHGPQPNVFHHPFTTALRTAFHLPPPHLHPQVSPDLQRLQESNDYEDLWQLAEQVGDAQHGGLPGHMIDRLPVTPYQPPTPVTRGAGIGKAAGKATMEEESMCAICMEQYRQADSVCTLPCVHHFHEHCINTWLKEKGLCPVCRIEVKSALSTS